MKCGLKMIMGFRFENYCLERVDLAMRKGRMSGTWVDRGRLIEIRKTSIPARGSGNSCFPENFKRVQGAGGVVHYKGRIG